MPLYGLTITGDIKTQYPSQHKEIGKFRRFEYDSGTGYKVKPKKIKYLAEPPGPEDKPDSGTEPVADLRIPANPRVATIDSVEVDPEKLSRISSEQVLNQPSVAGTQNRDSAGKLAHSTGPSAKAETGEEAKLGGPPAEEKKGGGQKAQTEAKAGEEKGDNEDSKAEARGTGGLLPEPGAGKDPPPDPEREKRYKKHIFITARVHPGESQASHMVHGVINFLLSDQPEAQEIRDKFVVKVIPMLNPDGVIHGNYRVSLLGVDLNRRWKKPSRFLHPTVYSTKQLIKYFNEKSRAPGCASGGVVMCCDFHGHSRNMDCFMYSCVDPDSSLNNVIIRACPTAVDRAIPIFNYRECKFAVERDKENTARVVLFKELGILASFTLESTFYGSDFLKRAKPGVGQIVPKEELQAQAARYGVSAARKDISIDEGHLTLVGEDFVRGINYASKKRPLLAYWFRCPPRVIVGIDLKYDPFADPDVDPELLALEQAWKHTGKVQEAPHLGLGGALLPTVAYEAPDATADKADGEKKPKRKRADGDAAASGDAAEKVKRKGSKTEKPFKNKRQAKPDGQLSRTRDRDMHPDLEEAKPKGKGKGKKKRPKKAQDGLKPLRTEASLESLAEANSVEEAGGPVSPLRAGLLRPRKGKKKSPSSARKERAPPEDEEPEEPAQEAAQEPHSPPPQGLSPASPSQGAPKVAVPIPVPLPGAQDSGASDEASNEEEPPQAPLQFKDIEGEASKQRARANASPLGVTPGDAGEDDVPREVDPGTEQRTPKKGLSLRSLVKGAAGDEAGGPTLPGPQKKAGGAELAQQKRPGAGDEAPSRRIDLRIKTSERRAEVDVGARGGEADSASARGVQLQLQEALEQVSGLGSRLEHDPFLDTERSSRATGAHSRLLSDQGKLTSRADTFKQRSKFLQKAKETEVPAVSELGRIEDAAFPDEQRTSQGLGTATRHLTQQVSAADLDAGLGPPSQQRAVAALEDSLHRLFSKNRLSVDPLVFPSTKLEAVSTIGARTVERAQRDLQHSNFQSPRRSAKSVFAPANGVYNSSQLLMNPDLAKKQGIHFYLGSPPVLLQGNGLAGSRAALSPAGSVGHSASMFGPGKARGAAGGAGTFSQARGSSSLILPNAMHPSVDTINSASTPGTGAANHTGAAGAGRNFGQGFHVTDYLNE